MEPIPRNVGGDLCTELRFIEKLLLRPVHLSRSVFLMTAGNRQESTFPRLWRPNLWMIGGTIKNEGRPGFAGAGDI